MISKTKIILVTLSFILVVFPVFTGAQNGKWKCVKKSDSVFVYSKKSNSSNLQIIKAETEIKTSLSALVALLIDNKNHKNWVYLNKKTNLLQKKNDFEWFLYSQTDAPWPVTDRDIITHARLSQDKKTKVVTIYGEAVPDYIPKDPHHVRIPYAQAQWQFIPENDGWVKVIFTMSIDMGGSIPKWLVNLTAAKGPFETIRRMRKEVKKKKYRTAHLPYIIEP
ncbi:hypothetical protein LA303_01835 [Candidatus Sulfidibacterium hydrothermale]|uniref:START domain-containing protein n=1 Tax=Candidatus Sulfidibacterium hydrothermale TaxID=2875962 RepID=UPI001F0B7202|nr:START domain-containing protein [Candidatus Sulfidibacterium hydrothermale]UBM62733.1 hypothetical protein LA303_01835 [Candidatus Sulfidibacterium hydrothermale]